MERTLPRPTRRFAALALLLSTAACATVQAPPAEPAPPVATVEPSALHPTLVSVPEVHMAADTAFLTAEERQVVNLLNEASGYMTQIYLRQRFAANPQVRQAIERSRRADQPDLLKLFDRNLGPWDEFADRAPFWGTTPMPQGAGFYPTDLTQAEFEAYLSAHPAEKPALTSAYTVVKRDGAKLVAVPYSVEYREWLEPAAKLLDQAAATTTNASLKKFLSLRAKAFRDDDYYPSELAWMDLKDTPIEVAIGPYEVYTDELMGLKTAFESFVTLKDPEESAALAKYKAHLRAMELNLPIDQKYKNLKRGSESPIAVAEQIHDGGDNVVGGKTIAFNLPNDERVREAKGAKKVILSNVLGAKFDRILKPMAVQVLVPEQAGNVSKKYMQLETLFHELSHSLGPGSITVGGRATTVDKELKEQNSGLEEAKADVAGAWNVLYMMKIGELPAAERSQLYATYIGDVFRHLRFGTVDAHSKGSALQYGYLRAHGALVWDASARRFRIDEAKMEDGLKGLLHDMLMVQATGDYAGAKAMLTQYAALDPEAKSVIATMESIPVDITPIYPDRI